MWIFVWHPALWFGSVGVSSLMEFRLFTCQFGLIRAQPEPNISLKHNSRGAVPGRWVISAANVAALGISIIMDIMAYGVGCVV